MKNQNDFGGTHTWKDTAGSVAVLVAMFLGTLSGVYTVYSEATQVASRIEIHSV